MPATTIPYPAPRQQPPISTSVLRAPWVCSWCSQAYGTRKIEAAPACLWPCEPASQSHGVCPACDGEIRAGCDMQPWIDLRFEHLARAKKIVAALKRRKGRAA